MLLPQSIIADTGNSVYHLFLLKIQKTENPILSNKNTGNNNPKNTDSVDCSGEIRWEYAEHNSRTTLKILSASKK